MPEIDILMAVKNGEKFIREQIDSILNQTFQDFRLLIRDNGSSDNTPAIIEEYVQRYPDKIQAVHDDVECSNSLCRNFMQLLANAEANYVMFSDCDDVWLPYKVQISLWHIKELERKNPGLPALVFSGLNVVDQNLRSMERFRALSPHSSEYKRFTNLMISNIVSGCTLIMNRALYSESKGFIDGMPMLHDGFFALLASLTGVIEHIPAAMMLYRQHNHNVLGYMGVGRGHGYIKNWLVKIGRLRRSSWLKKMCVFFRKNYADIIPPEKMSELEKFEAFLGRNMIVKFFMLLFGKGYKLDGKLYSRIKFFLRLVAATD